MNEYHVIIIAQFLVLLVTTIFAMRYQHENVTLLDKLAIETGLRQHFEKQADQWKEITKKTARANTTREYKLYEALDARPRPLSFSVFDSTIDGFPCIDGGVIDLLTCEHCGNFDRTTKRYPYGNVRLCRDCTNMEETALLYGNEIVSSD